LRGHVDPTFTDDRAGYGVRFVSGVTTVTAAAGLDLPGEEDGFRLTTISAAAIRARTPTKNQKAGGTLLGLDGVSPLKPAGGSATALRGRSSGRSSRGVRPDKLTTTSKRLLAMNGRARLPFRGTAAGPAGSAAWEMAT
jgi:hypothetical protein